MKMTDAVLQAILEALVDTGGPFDPVTSFVGVATAIEDLGALTTLANVVSAPGAVGTRKVVTAWSASYKLSDGRWAVDGSVARFVPASAADECQIAGWYVASLITAGVLKAFGKIFPAVPLVDQTSAFSLVVRITIDPEGRWSQEVMWNG